MIYIVSDIHSSLTKFLSSIPKDAKKIIINGDLFNKGFEQEQMIFWLIKNYNNPKYVFIFGNHEIRFFNELRQMLNANKIQSYNDDLFDSWYQANNDYNSANIAYRLIQENKIDADVIFKNVLKSFNWYYLQKGKMYNYIISHASWEFKKSPKDQDKRNLVYDTTKMFVQIKKKVNPYIDKIANIYYKNNIRHVFGHYVCPKVFKQPAPYINREVFYFIDNGVFKKNNNFFFLPVE